MQWNELPNWNCYICYTLKRVLERRDRTMGGEGELQCRGGKVESVYSHLISGDLITSPQKVHAFVHGRDGHPGAWCRLNSQSSLLPRSFLVLIKADGHLTHKARVAHHSPSFLLTSQKLLFFRSAQTTLCCYYWSEYIELKESREQIPSGLQASSVFDGVAEIFVTFYLVVRQMRVSLLPNVCSFVV